MLNLAVPAYVGYLAACPLIWISALRNTIADADSKENCLWSVGTTLHKRNMHDWSNKQFELVASVRKCSFQHALG